MPKIAVSGKGGVGKTTLASLLAHLFAEEGRTVFAVDADPSANLALALGVPTEVAARITPIVEMKELIEERTGARAGEYGGYFNLTPRVDDIPETYSAFHRGVHLLVMGSVRGPGAGCLCPENAVLKSLMAHLLLSPREVVILDMVAGFEHLGRGTAGAVDHMLVVMEPGRRSIDTGLQIVRLAHGLGIPRVEIVINKVHSPEDIDLVRRFAGDTPIVGHLPFSFDAIEADRTGQSAYDIAPELVAAAIEIAHHVAGATETEYRFRKETRNA